MHWVFNCRRRSFCYYGLYVCIFSYDLINKSNCNCASYKGNDDALKNCWTSCEFKENRIAFLVIAIVFAAIYCLSMIILAGSVKERPQIDMITPNFPASINTARYNLAMSRFILPAMLDTSIVYIIFPFLPYFVQYILNPITLCSDNTEYYNKLRCRSTYWIGFLVLAYVAGTLISLPLWFMSIKKIQKKPTWVTASLLQIIFLPLLAIPKDIYMIIPMCVFFMIGICQGGGFLQRLILSDIIDYDEFLHLRRSEGVYVGIIEGLSKLTIVMVKIIPFTFMYIAGYEKPELGVPKDQETSVEIYIQIVFFIFRNKQKLYIAVPSLLTFINIFLKKRFPKWSTADIDRIELRSQKIKLLIAKQGLDNIFVDHPLTKEATKYGPIMYFL